jgi:diamine N-acetyltransferase
LSFIESEKLLLRAVEPSDIDLLYLWENDVSLWRLSNTLIPFSKHIIKLYIQNSFKDIYELKQLRLIIDLKSEKRSIGAIDLFDFDPFHARAGVGILIATEQDRGKGFASEAVKLLKEYAFNILQIHQLYCNISSDNTASLDLFQKAGFEISGLKKDWIKVSNNQWLDEYILQFRVD